MTELGPLGDRGCSAQASWDGRARLDPEEGGRTLRALRPVSLNGAAGLCAHASGTGAAACSWPSDREAATLAAAPKRPGRGLALRSRPWRRKRTESTVGGCRGSGRRNLPKRRTGRSGRVRALHRGLHGTSVDRLVGDGGDRASAG